MKALGRPQARSSPSERNFWKDWSIPVFRRILREEALAVERCPTNRNIFKRLYMYGRCFELRAQGLRYEEIKRALEADIGDATYFAKWLQGTRCPANHTVIFDICRPEVGTVLGAALAEGYEYWRQEYPTYRIEIVNANSHYLRKIRTALESLGLTVTELGIASESGGAIKYEVYSALLYLLVKHYRSFLLAAPKEVQRAFLRSVFTGDGGVSKKQLTFQ